MTDRGNHWAQPVRAPVAVVVVGAGHQLAPAQLDGVRSASAPRRWPTSCSSAAATSACGAPAASASAPACSRCAADGDRLAQVVGRALGGEQFRDRIDR